MAPQPVHNVVKEQLPVISQVPLSCGSSFLMPPSSLLCLLHLLPSLQSPCPKVLLLGDKQKFCSCFLTLAVEVDTETMVKLISTHLVMN